jgi:hypothetical protein
MRKVPLPNNGDKAIDGHDDGKRGGGGDSRLKAEDERGEVNENNTEIAHAGVGEGVKEDDHDEDDDEEDDDDENDDDGDDDDDDDCNKAGPDISSPTCISSTALDSHSQTITISSSIILAGSSSSMSSSNSDHRSQVLDSRWEVPDAAEPSRATLKSQQQPGRKARTKRIVTINTEGCKYDIVRECSERFGLKIVDGSPSWSVYWIDTGVSVQRILDM